MLLRDVTLPATLPLLSTGGGSTGGGVYSLVSLDLDGSVSIRAGQDYSGEALIGECGIMYLEWMLVM